MCKAGGYMFFYICGTLGIIVGTIAAMEVWAWKERRTNEKLKAYELERQRSSTND